MARINGGDVAMAFLGLLLGGYIALCAAAMTGFGHGWGSAMTSAISVVGYPLATVAWRRRREVLGACLAVIAVAIALYADVKIYSDTVREGMEYVGRVSPTFRLQWGALFASWQVLAVIVLLLWCCRLLLQPMRR